MSLTFKNPRTEQLAHITQVLIHIMGILNETQDDNRWHVNAALYCLSQLNYKILQETCTHM